MVKVLPRPLKPSYMLGFLLLSVWAMFGLIVVLEAQYFGNDKPIDFEKSHWVVLLGVMAAVSGWIVTSFITIRNSVKQHTINTLLQSRLSATYIENVRAANKRYFSLSGIRPITKAEIERADPDAQLAALGYILNYLEFVAVGIRHGDLDESLMRQTFRGMVCSMREVGHEYILNARESIRLENRKNAPAVPTGTPPENAIFEHLDWLYTRWYDEKLKRPHVAASAAHSDNAEAQFKKLGYRMPKNLEEYNCLLQLIDLSSEAGCKARASLENLRVYFPAE